MFIINKRKTNIPSHLVLLYFVSLNKYPVVFEYYVPCNEYSSFIVEKIRISSFIMTSPLETFSQAAVHELMDDGHGPK